MHFNKCECKFLKYEPNVTLDNKTYSANKQSTIYLNKMLTIIVWYRLV